MNLKWINKRQQNLLFLFCWCAYVAVYLGRYNYSAALADMVVRGVMTKSQGGLIATCFYITYGSCQIFSGFLGDKLDSRWMVGIGLGVSGLMNLLIGMVSTWQVMLVFWMINGVAQSMVWSPMLRLLAEKLPRERSLKAGIDIATTVPAGSILSYGITALTLFLVGWRGSFMAPGIILLAMCALWMLGVGNLEKHADTAGEEVTEAKKEESGPKAKLMSILIPSGILIMMLAVMMQGALRDSVTTWMPTYLTEGFGLSAEVASIASMVLPIVNLIGVYVGSWLNKKVLKDEVLTAAVLFLIAAVTLGAIVLMKKPPLVPALLILGIANAASHTVNTMLISLLPMYFARERRVSTLTGLLNAIVYVGSSISAYGIGAISDAAGWGMTQLIWCVISVAGTVLLFVARIKWAPYKKRRLAEEKND